MTTKLWLSCKGNEGKGEKKADAFKSLNHKSCWDIIIFLFVWAKYNYVINFIVA